MEGDYNKLVCHRCNENYALICTRNHSHWNCDEYYDIRLCECGQYIHKVCYKNSLYCPMYAVVELG